MASAMPAMMLAEGTKKVGALLEPSVALTGLHPARPRRVYQQGKHLCLAPRETAGLPFP